jgi:hypothetical protein
VKYSALVLALSFVPKAHAELACHVANADTQLFSCEDDAHATFTEDGWKSSPSGFVKEADDTPDGRPAHSAHYYQCLTTVAAPPTRGKDGMYYQDFTRINISVTYSLGGQSHTDTALMICFGRKQMMVQPL